MEKKKILSIISSFAMEFDEPVLLQEDFEELANRLVAQSTPLTPEEFEEWRVGMEKSKWKKDFTESELFGAKAITWEIFYTFTLTRKEK